MDDLARTARGDELNNFLVRFHRPKIAAYGHIPKDDSQGPLHNVRVGPTQKPVGRVTDFAGSASGPEWFDAEAEAMGVEALGHRDEAEGAQPIADGRMGRQERAQEPGEGQEIEERSQKVES